MKGKILSAVKVIFFLSLGFALIFLFAGKLTEKEKEEIWQAIVHADYTWVFISMIFGTLAHISRALRWKQLLQPLGYNPSTRNTFFAVMIMYFANLAVPRLGEVTRCAILRRYEKIPLEKSFGTVVAERAIDLVLLGVLFLITLVVQWDMVMEGFASLEAIGNPNQEEGSSLFLPVAGVIILIGLGLLFLFRKNAKILLIYKKVLDLILGFVSGLKAALQVKKPLTFFAHSIFIYIMYIMMVYICFFAMPQTAGLSFSSCLVLLIFGSVGIILVPGGIGIYPLIVAKVLIMYNVAEVDGYAFGWVVWLGQTLLLVILGLVSLAVLPYFNRKPKAPIAATTE